MENLIDIIVITIQLCVAVFGSASIILGIIALVCLVKERKSKDIDTNKNSIK